MENFDKIFKEIQVTDNSSIIFTIFCLLLTLFCSYVLKYTFENSMLAVTRKNWAVYNNSWSDPNVTNTLRGVILKKTDYFESPDEFFGSIVLHLRQVGFEIPLNYSFISEYISANVPENSEMALDISNQEKKALKREVESFADNFGYDLS